MLIFKSKGAYLKDKGTMSDLSKKIELFIEELSDEQVVALNKLVKQKSVDVIIMGSGSLNDMENILAQVKDISETDFSVSENDFLLDDTPVEETQ